MPIPVADKKLIVQPLMQKVDDNSSGSTNPSKIITSTVIPSTRRKFIGNSLLLFAGFQFVALKTFASIEKIVKSGRVSFKKKFLVSPPGSYSIENFTKHCTACQLCVSECPTQVLQPSIGHYGVIGMMQPHLDFDHSFCNYECTKCSEVCPNGAIDPITIARKKTIQTGKVNFLKENCIVYADETACGACSEHCPTKAVRSVPYKGSLTIPEINVNICIGCGACEFACPTKPYKAIYVEGNPFHLTARKPTEKKLKNVIPQEFPF
jgi:ferredoxin